MSDRATVKQKSGLQTNTAQNVTTEVSRVGIITVAAFGALVGLWSLACLVGGLSASGGPLAFVGNWFKAVTGM
ncbi:MAG: hypothetical protein WBW79_01140 [Desulfocapsaceae bacterium]|jgi:hypothetical protein